MKHTRLHLMLSPENAEWLQSQVGEGYGISRLVDAMVTAQRTFGPIVNRMEAAVNETLQLIQTRQGKNLPSPDMHVEVLDTGDIAFYGDAEDTRLSDPIPLPDFIEIYTPEQEALRAHQCPHKKGEPNA